MESARLFFGVCFLFCAVAITAQNHGPKITNNEFEESHILQLQSSERDSLFFLREQISLFTDKTNYSKKDILFFKAQVLSGPKLQPSSLSEVLKVELLDEKGTLLTSQFHKIENGSTSGSLEIPKKIEDGKYYLRTYTRWMLNYGPEQLAIREIQIGDTINLDNPEGLEKTEVTFYPEGGQLLPGLENRLVMKSGGLNLENAVIVDSQGEKVSNVQTYPNSLGTAILKVKPNEDYFLLTENGGRISLPEITDIGYALQVNNLDSEKLHIRILATSNLKNQQVNLRGISNGITYFEAKVDFAQSEKVNLEIPKKGIPEGLLSLVIQDEFDQVWAQRPIYISKENLKLMVERQNDSNENEEVLKITLLDDEGNPVETDLSLSVTNEVEVGNDLNQIISEKLHRAKVFNTDLQLLSNQFSIDGQENIDLSIPSEIYYGFQKGLEFYGQGYDLNNNLLIDKKIQVLVSTDDAIEVIETKTNANGMFKIAGLQINGEAKMVFRTVANETRAKLVKVIPYEYKVPPLTYSDEDYKDRVSDIEKSVPSKALSNSSIDDSSADLIALDGVTLIEKKVERSYKPSVYGIEPSRVVYQDIEKPATIPELFLGIPGVQISGLGGLDPRIILPRSAGVGPILWVVDGLPLIQPTSLNEIISLVPFIDLDRIEILFGAQASIYGTRAAGGAILVYTRSGSFDDYFNRKEAQLTFEGYYDSMDFERFKNSKEYRKTDNSQSKTIYWNPSLKTNANGEVFLRFKKDSDLRAFKVKARAIASDGRRVSVSRIF